MDFKPKSLTGSHFFLILKLLRHKMVVILGISMRCFTFLFLFMLLVSFSMPKQTHAQGPGTATILGAGGSSCPKYLNDIQSSPAFQSLYLNWAMGYFTALNVMNALKPGAKTMTGPQGVEDWLKTYCNTHALNSFADAVMALGVGFYQTPK
jgi:hypothetical protein